MRQVSAMKVMMASSLLALLLPLGMVNAASPHAVDPDSLSPTLNPLYAPYDCWTTGAGPVCRGESDEQFSGEVLDWFDCDGHTVYVSGTAHQQITRWHLPDGRATKTILTLAIPGDVFSLSPSGDGPSVTLRTRLTKHYEYLEPGVRDSRVMRSTGALLVVKASDGGVIAHEVGWVEFAPGKEDEEITDLRGPKDLLDDFDGFVDKVCDHLLGEAG